MTTHYNWNNIQCPSMIQTFLFKLMSLSSLNSRLHSHWLSSIFFYFFNLFILRGYRGRERERERGRERIPSRLHTVSEEPNSGLEFIYREITTEPKSRVRCLTDWNTQAPQPLLHFLSNLEDTRAIALLREMVWSLRVTLRAEVLNIGVNPYFRAVNKVCFKAFMAS